MIPPGQEPVITLNINFEDITVDLHYPLEVKTGDQHSVLDDMRVYLPLRLNRSYELATCLVNKIVFDEGRDTTDPFDEAPDGDAFKECKDELELDDYFTTRIRPFIKDGEFKGRLVAINDTRNQENTGVAFEFQYMIWKCSGNFFSDKPDEQRMRICEYSCAKGIPEVVALGLCQQESDCEHFMATPPPAEPKSAEPHSNGNHAAQGWLLQPGQENRRERKLH